MPTLEKRGLVLHTPLEANLSNEQEFALLYDVHMSTNPKFPYWSYERFDLDEKNKERMLEFRFYSEGIYELATDVAT